MTETVVHQSNELVQPVQDTPQNEVDSPHQIAFYIEPHGNKHGGEMRGDGGDFERDQLSADAGCGVHAVTARLAYSKKGLRGWIRKYYADAPGYQRAWAYRTANSLDDLRAILPQTDETTEVNFIHETRMYVPKQAKHAARSLARLLRRAREYSSAFGLQFEDTLRANPYSLRPGESSNDFHQLVYGMNLPKEWTHDDGSPILHDDIIEYAHDARTLHREFGGNLNMQQSVRSDMIIIEHDKTGNNAEWVSEVSRNFRKVLNSGNAYNPEALSEMEFKLPGSTEVLNGNDIICEAAKLIMLGDMRLKLVDTKVLTRKGEQYDGTDPIWKANGGRLVDLFSINNLMQDGQGFANLRSILSKNMLDVAKTKGSLEYMFSTSLLENDVSATMSYLMSKIEYAILFVDFDIRSKGKSKKPGVPATVSYGLVPISFDQIQVRWDEWVSRIYTNRALGELALKKAKEYLEIEEMNTAFDAA